jgi:uroporphyrinogen-III synthase
VNRLAERTVVVTRALGQHRELTGLLEAEGAVPVLFPTIAIRPARDVTALDAALREAARYDWLVFTSANAVSHVWDRFAALGGATLPPTVRIAAVGPTTARALADRGAAVSAIPDAYRGSEVAGALGTLTGRRVLLPRADIGRDETVEALRAAGAEVVAVTAYHTIPAEPDPAGLAALRSGVDAVTFTAPSTVRNFALLLADEAAPLLRRTTVACIGPSTADAVASLGLAPPLTAAAATAPGLVAALAAYFSRPAPAGRPA